MVVAPKLRARLGDAVIHGVVGQRQVVFKAANVRSLRRGRGCFVENQGHCNPPSVLPFLQVPDTTDGDVESKVPWAAADALNPLRLSAKMPFPSLERPIRGDVAALHYEWTQIAADG